MGKSKQNKILAKIAKTFPTVFRNTVEYEFMTGAEMKEKDNVHEVNGIPVDDKTMYKCPFPVQIAINHKRRMKKLVAQFGTGILPQYAIAVSNELKKQSA